MCASHEIQHKMSFFTHTRPRHTMNASMHTRVASYRLEVRTQMMYSINTTSLLVTGTTTKPVTTCAQAGLAWPHSAAL